MKSVKSAILILLFAAVVAGVYLYAVGDLKFDREEVAGPNNTGFLKTEAEFRTKLAELRIEQNKMERRKELMIERKDEIVAELKEKGITSTSDISDKDVKYKITNLKKSVSDIKVVDKSIGKYQQGIDAIEAMLTKLEQERLSSEVAISEDKAKELSIMLLDLDEKLTEDENILEEEALREMLGLELGE
ncbi:hypothetical protein [Mariniblastus fucicola]|uniref:Chromosome partition protein Smc n=1 Tax=Mariniblastus fucicola TaxID=980251 RepID=A0A5B9PC73_9BACT|nr:hypothetical protein [Mariniblastus fucicola]QEG22765.1 hypothetical protein MFFC18_26480 [Mariniblastus fucicola]